MSAAGEGSAGAAATPGVEAAAAVAPGAETAAAPVPAADPAPRLTVVVPSYNVEDWVDRCLESLEAQDFPDFEVVCVNDGSTDGTRDRLARWEARDARVRVVDQQNAGLSAARNAGIRAARGDYVCFLDADDRLVPRACGRIVAELDRTAADVLVFGARCVPEDASVPDWLTECLHPRDVVYDGFSMELMLRENARPFAWRLALRRDFLRETGLRFDETVRFAEDQVFCFAAYPRSRRTALVSDELYEYQVGRAGSLMTRLEGDFGAKMLEHAVVVDRIFLDWDALGILRAHAAEMVGFALDFSLYDAIKLPDESYLPVARRLRETLSRYWSAGEVAAMELPRATRSMALRCCYRTDMTARGRKALALEYRLQRKGVRSLLRRVAEKIGG